MGVGVRKGVETARERETARAREKERKQKRERERDGAKREQKRLDP